MSLQPYCDQSLENMVGTLLYHWKWKYMLRQPKNDKSWILGPNVTQPGCWMRTAITQGVKENNPRRFVGNQVMIVCTQLTTFVNGKCYSSRILKCGLVGFLGLIFANRKPHQCQKSKFHKTLHRTAVLSCTSVRSVCSLHRFCSSLMTISLGCMIQQWRMLISWIANYKTSVKLHVLMFSYEFWYVFQCIQYCVIMTTSLHDSTLQTKHSCKT